MDWNCHDHSGWTDRPFKRRSTTAMSLAMPVGLLAAGPISERIGIQNLFLLSGITIIVTGVFCWHFTRPYDRL